MADTVAIASVLASAYHGSGDGDDRPYNTPSTSSSRKRVPASSSSTASCSSQSSISADGRSKSTPALTFKKRKPAVAFCSSQSSIAADHRSKSTTSIVFGKRVPAAASCSSQGAVVAEKRPKPSASTSYKKKDLAVASSASSQGPVLKRMPDLQPSIFSDPRKSRPKGSKPRSNQVAEHPKYAVMIADAIQTLQERGGSSRQAILKYITAKYNLGDEVNRINARVKFSLKAGVKNGNLQQVKGTGATGSFRLGEKSAKKTAAKPNIPRSKTTKIIQQPAASKSPPKKGKGESAAKPTKTKAVAKKSTKAVIKKSTKAVIKKSTKAVTKKSTKGKSLAIKKSTKGKPPAKSNYYNCSKIVAAKKAKSPATKNLVKIKAKPPAKKS